MTTQPEVAVVGSINLDLSVGVERFPEPGETVRGTGLHRGGGGKGANQAVAAARLGRRVALIGRVGSDDALAGMKSALADEGVDVSHVQVDTEQSTGLALIEVESSGENRIVVVPGANNAVDESDLDAAAEVLAAADAILVQMEIPAATVEALAGYERSGTLILNPAPAAPIDLSGVDVLVPNRTELALLASASPVSIPSTSVTEPGGLPASALDDIVDQVQALSAGLRAVVVTLGGAGAVVVEGLGQTIKVEHVPALPVDVVDTTGAGDAFCGGLADALCLGSGLVDAARWASRVSAAAVTKRGAWAALPHRATLLG